MLLIHSEVKQATHTLADLGLEGVFADEMLITPVETADNIAVQPSVSNGWLVKIMPTLAIF